MKKLLIVIDMQKDFIDGALGSEEAVAIVENVLEKIRSYPAENRIATMDTHGTDYMETQEGRTLRYRTVSGTPMAGSFIPRSRNC